jgi:hypothetical protein
MTDHKGKRRKSFMDRYIPKGAVKQLAWIDNGGVQ